MNYTVDQALLTEIYDLLYYLGLRATRTNFFHLSFAVYLSVQHPERMLSLTKWLYPDVAKHYGTNWNAVERNIRTAIACVWLHRRDTLCVIAGCNLNSKPTAGQFIRILQSFLQDNRAA